MRHTFNSLIVGGELLLLGDEFVHDGGGQEGLTVQDHEALRGDVDLYAVGPVARRHHLLQTLRPEHA